MYFVYLSSYQISTSNSITNSISTQHGFSSSQTIGGTLLGITASTNKAYNFSQTEQSSATSVTNINFDKDIFINNYSLYYWDSDEVIPDPTGVPNNTWYGQIPGNSGSGLDLLYFEFRIHD